MKSFSVEMRRTSFITVFVEAENREEAEQKAWKEIENEYESKYAEWETGYIEEQTA